jgi:class 3 adenylate cyclase
MQAGSDRPADGVHRTAYRGFLFADLRGYTAVADRRGDRAAVELLARYRELVRGAISADDGHEVRTEGDSFYVVFPSASAAVRAGIAIAEAAERAGSVGGLPIKVGIGVHAGEIADTDEGPVGSAVNVASRLCSQARAGEVLVSDVVRSLVRTSTELYFERRGPQHLKGVSEPVVAYAARTSVVSARRRDQAVLRRIRRGVSPRRVTIGAAAVAVIVAASALVRLGGPALTGSEPRGSAGATGPASASPVLVEGDTGPGEFHSTALDTAFSLSVPAMWRILSLPESSREVVLERTDRLSSRVEFSVARLLMDVASSASPSAVGCRTSTRPISGDILAAWVQAYSSLTASPEVRVTIAGRLAHEFDVEVRPNSGCHPGSFVPLWKSDAGAYPFTLSAGDRARLVFVDLDPGVDLAAAERAPTPEEFGRLIPAADELLAGLSVSATAALPTATALPTLPPLILPTGRPVPQLAALVPKVIRGEAIEVVGAGFDDIARRLSSDPTLEGNVAAYVRDLGIQRSEIHQAIGYDPTRTLPAVIVVTRVTGVNQHLHRAPTGWSGASFFLDNSTTATIAVFAAGEGATELSYEIAAAMGQAPLFP